MRDLLVAFGIPAERGNNMISWKFWALFLLCFFLILSASVITTGSPLPGAAIMLLLFFFVSARIDPVIVVAILLASGGIAFGFLTGYKKNLFLSLGGVHMDGVRLFAAVSALGAAAAARGYLMKNNPLKVYILFIVFGAFTLIYTDSRMEGLRLLFKLLLPYLIFLVILNETGTEKRLKFMEWSLTAGALLLLAISIIMLAAGNGFSERVTVLRFEGPTGGWSPFASFTVLLGLYFFARHTYLKKKTDLVIFTLLLVFTYLSMTRTEIGALSFGIIFLSLIGNKRWTDRIINAGTAGSLICAMVFFQPLTSRVFGFGIPDAGKTSTGKTSTREISTRKTSTRKTSIRETWDFYSNIPTLTSGRSTMWADALEMSHVKPFTGWGLGARLKVPKSMHEEDVVPHNEYIRVLVYTGAIGLVLFLVSYIWLFRLCVKSFFAVDEAKRYIPAAALAGLIAYAVINTSDNGIDWYAPCAQYVWSFAGLSLTFLKLK